jgi:Ca2+-binding RTX toxin-like protein
MAIATANTAIDMLNPTIWYGSVYGANSTRIVITDYSTKIAVYDGKNFKYSGSKLISGTLSAFGQYKYSDTSNDYLVTGLNLDAKKVYGYVQSGQAGALYNYALSGADTINGSSSADFLRGFAGNDVIYGNGGVDTIYGDDGKDTLSGGAGADAFVFNLKPSKTNFDTITDFLTGTDGLILNSSIFTKLIGDTNLSDNFVKGSKALDSNDYLIFNPSNNTLYYDADGSGKNSSALAVAKLVGVTDLNVSNDFFIV